MKNESNKDKIVSKKRNNIPINITQITKKENNKIINDKKNSKKIKITFKKYSMDRNDLNIKVNNNNNNTSDSFDNKKRLKTEINNNKKIIINPKYKENKTVTNKTLEKNKNSKEIKKSKENFGEYILQKKLKLFSLTNSNNKNNTYTINIPESNIASTSSKNINHDNNNIKTETNIELNNNKKQKRNIILSMEKIETKINKNREILFNSSQKNNISPKRIKSNITSYKDKNNLDVKSSSYKKTEEKSNKINKSLTKKEIEIQLSNNEMPTNNKEKVINYKKNKSPVKIDINLDNSYHNSNNDNNDKVSLEKDLLNKKETNILSILKEHKIQSKKKKNSISEELLNKKEDELTNTIDSEKTKQKQDNYYNIFKQVKSINERKEKHQKILSKNNHNDLILPLNTIETDTFRKSTKNKIIKNNHYKTLFTQMYYDNSSNTIKTKKKFKFNERKKNGTNKDLKNKLIESTKNYLDLYKKAFNETSLEQKFSFKPKNNKIYFNNNTFSKKISHPSFNPKNKKKTKRKNLNNCDNINNNFFENINTNDIKDINEFDNNKNLILDLNHFIPIDKVKFINTFSKSLFGNENNQITNKEKF